MRFSKIVKWVVVLGFMPSMVFAQSTNENIQFRGSGVIHEINFCFTSQKVDSLHKAFKVEDDFYHSKISDKEFESLNVMQGLIFALEYPESYKQICMSFSPDMEWNNKIHANLETTYEGKEISKRQLDFLKMNRDSVVAYLNSCIADLNYISKPIKELMLKLNGVECIPNIINLLNKPDYFDTYNLTVLMKLMIANNYKPFMSSSIYSKIYGKDSNYKTSISFSKQNKEHILLFSEQFFNSL